MFRENLFLLRSKKLDIFFVLFHKYEWFQFIKYTQPLQHYCKRKDSVNVLALNDFV